MSVDIVFSTLRVLSASATKHMCVPCNTVLPKPTTDILMQDYYRAEHVVHPAGTVLAEDS